MMSSYLAGNGADAYTLRNWLDDIFNDIWKSTIKGSTPNDCDRILQNLYLTFLTKNAPAKGSLSKAKSLAFSGESYLPSVDHIVTFGLDESGVLADNIDFLRSVEEENGIGYIASQMALDKYGPAGYNWQRTVNTRAIDDSKTMFYGEAKRLEKLLTKAVSSSRGEVRTHYESMLYRLQAAMNIDK